MSKVLDVTYTPGGHRQASRVDIWTIIAKGDQGTSIVESIPCSKGPQAVNTALDRLAKKPGYELAPNAKFDIPAPAL